MEREAQDTYRELLAVAPLDTEVMRALAELQVRAKNADAARALLRKGLGTLPGNPVLLQALVMVDMRTGGLDAALATATELAKDRANLPTARLLKGGLYMSVQRYADAAAAYQTQLDASPSTSLAVAAAVALNSAGRAADSQRLLQDWVVSHPGDIEAIRALSALDLQNRRMAEAEKNLQVVLAAQPADPVALNNLAWIYQTRNDPRARAMAQKAYLLSPGPQSADTLGWILTRQGDTKIGLLLLTQAASNLPADPAIFYHLAVALNLAGQKDKAVEILTRLTSAPTDFEDKPAARKLLAELGGAKPKSESVAVAMAPLRLLTFTTLFPNREQPNHGIFVETRLRQLVAGGAVRSTVLAPVPFFPSGAALFGRWGAWARVPALELRHGLAVHHPRFLVIPRIGMNLSPFLLHQASRRALRRLLAGGQRFDAIDAHYLYPDGVAAVRLGAEFGLPVVLTARGSDVTQFPDYPVPRRLILDAVARAAAVITVSAGLRAALLALGAAAEKITVLRNGVDTQLFRSADRDAARAALGLSGPVLISAGALIERKRHHLTIEALRLLPAFSLLIIGEGPERARLAALAGRLGLAGRVRLAGARPHMDMPQYYSAADISILASSREGWANVLLESMACGTPVVASDIPGNAEVVQDRAAGLIAPANTPEGIAAAVRDLWAAMPSRAATRAYAERFGWEETSLGQIGIFRSVTGAGARLP